MADSKTYSILLIVDGRDITNATHNEQWNTCAVALGALTRRNKDVVSLGENAVLLSLTHGLQGVFEALGLVGSLKYKSTVLTEDTEWHESPMVNVGS